ncbi:Cell death protease [Loxospora ochrophaea]|nr:Cell death protease [Loxospora ochrophaea]
MYLFDSRLSSWSRGSVLLSLQLCLLLRPSTSVAAKTAADYYVHSLPGQPEGPLLKMHAGHIEVTPEHHGNLFFWQFENRHIANRQRTVIWLNGGPGCSSEDGALMEIGPYRLKDKEHLVYNEGSWDEFANLLFVDNPVGTGFSYVDTNSYVHELKDMADQMVTFLEKYFELFPEYEDNDLYLSGESYAGQHIPYIAQAILDRNKKPTVQHRWNLSGLLIGNGWISPNEQSLAYLEYAYKAGLVQRDSSIAKELEAKQALCITALNADKGKPHVDYPICEQILSDILRLTQRSGRCTNMYDVRLEDTWPSCGMNWPPDLVSVTPYLRRQDVISALHIDKDKSSGWTECSGSVGSNFNARNSKPSITLLPGLLERLPIVLFSGQKDLICNHIGTEELIHNMEWNGGKGFELSPGTWAPRRDWTFEGEPAGFYQEARNLTYILFYNSSHMVPFDYPRRTRDMLDRFLNVDIASIGGTPADSRIDGEKGVEVSVGGHPNSTAAEKEEAKKLDKAKLHAYYKSGEVVLVIVVICAGVWGYTVWQDRRRRAGYQGLFGGGGNDSNGHLGHGAQGLGLNGFRSKRRENDVEAADFDESELDDLHLEEGKSGREEEAPRYSLGGTSSDGEGEEMNGHAEGKEKGSENEKTDNRES